MSSSEAEKIKAFHTYLEDSIKAKRTERATPGISERSRDLLKTEIAELDIVRREFERLFFGDSGSALGLEKIFQLLNQGGKITSVRLDDGTVIPMSE